MILMYTWVFIHIFIVFIHFLFFVNAVDKNAPLRSLTKKERKIGIKPWISRAILNSIKYKNDLFH